MSKPLLCPISKQLLSDNYRRLANEFLKPARTPLGDILQRMKVINWKGKLKK